MHTNQRGEPPMGIALGDLSRGSCNDDFIGDLLRGWDFVNFLFIPWYDIVIFVLMKDKKEA